MSAFLEHFKTQFVVFLHRILIGAPNKTRFKAAKNTTGILYNCPIRPMNLQTNMTSCGVIEPASKLYVHPFIFILYVYPSFLVSFLDNLEKKKFTMFTNDRIIIFSFSFPLFFFVGEGGLLLFFLYSFCQFSNLYAIF